MGQFPCGRPREGRKIEVVFGPEGFKPSDPERTLSSPDHRRCSNMFAWSQGVYKTSCQEQFLACQTR